MSVLLRALAFSLPLVLGLTELPGHVESTLPRRSAAHCRAVPGTADWPGPEAWARLNVSTGGRLLQPSPPGAVCHPSQPSYNSALCPSVQEAWNFYPFHNDNPISVGSNEFTNDSCLPYTNYTCSLNGYPVFVINATTAEHAKLAVDFGGLLPLAMVLTFHNTAR